jgi:hypothetical protein
MSRIGQYKIPIIRTKAQHRIGQFLRNKEIFLDLDDKNLLVKNQLTKLGCKVLTLHKNLTKVTSVFISGKPLKDYTKKRFSKLSVDLLRKRTRGGRALKMICTMRSPAFSQRTSKCSLFKAKSLNPKIKFHYYPEIKARLDREVKLKHPHEFRFVFDMSAIKSRYPNACQYFITDAKGVHRIEPHIIVVPPRLYLDHPCDYQGSYFAKPRKEVVNKGQKSRLDIKMKVPGKLKQRVCDGCLRRYRDLDLHNKSKEHQEWYKATNFDDVDEFIRLVHRKREEKKRVYREDLLELITPNVKKVELNGSPPDVEELEEKIEQVRSPFHPEENRNFKYFPRASLSTAADTTVSTISENANSFTSERSERGCETKKSLDEGSLERPPNERRASANFLNVKTNNVTSLSTHSSSFNPAIPIEHKRISSYSRRTFPYPLSLNETKVSKNKRKRASRDSTSSPQAAKVAVSSSSLRITSQQRLCKSPLSPYQTNCQLMIINKLGAPEFKSRSGKRRKRIEVDKVLDRLFSKVKPKSEDRRSKLHEIIRSLAVTHCKRRKKLTNESENLQSQELLPQVILKVFEEAVRSTL